MSRIEVTASRENRWGTSRFVINDEPVRDWTDAWHRLIELGTTRPYMYLREALERYEAEKGGEI